MVQAVLSAVPLPEARLRAIVARAGGNPFFLEELAWDAMEQDLQGERVRDRMDNADDRRFLHGMGRMLPRLPMVQEARAIERRRLFERFFRQVCQSRATPFD